MLITVIIIFISHTVYAETYNESLVTRDDLVDCIFPINPNLSIIIRNEKNPLRPIISKQNIQNIGNVPVKITAGIYRCNIQPLQRKKLSLLVFKRLEIFLSVTSTESRGTAILCIPKCREEDRQKLNIKDIQKDFDKINVLKKTFTLGITKLPEENVTLTTLISYFWPKNTTNVWQQLYEVVKDCLNESNNTYNFINNDIEDIKKDMFALTESNVNDIAKKYISLANKIYLSLVQLEIAPPMEKFYILPIYNNAVTMAMYFTIIGIENPEMCKQQQNFFMMFRDYHQYACSNIKNIQEHSIRSIYETVHAAGVFNALMNAYNYISFHGMQQLLIWETIIRYYHIPCEYCKADCRDPILYSNLYGKATANLLQEAIHISKSPLAVYCEQNSRHAAKLESIIIYIRTENLLKIVYGLTLKFSPDFSTTMGCTKTTEKKEFNLEKERIINLKVYRTEFIRCLEFTLSNGTNSVFGNNCGNVFKEFQLKYHYINSMYLANDYPETDKYFDNIAVSFLPNNL